MSEVAPAYRVRRGDGRLMGAAGCVGPAGVTLQFAIAPSAARLGRDAAGLDLAHRRSRAPPLPWAGGEGAFTIQRADGSPHLAHYRASFTFHHEHCPEYFSTAGSSGSGGGGG